MKKQEELYSLLDREYQHGFVTEIEAETFAPGLDEDVIRRLSAIKGEPEFVLAWRLQAFRAWQTMTPPEWSTVHYPAIDYQAIAYYSAPKTQQDAPKSLDEVDPELLRTYEKLGIPLREQEFLAGVAVDAVFDSVSVATTFKAKLAEKGVIFCSFSEAVHQYPELIQKYLLLNNLDFYLKIFDLNLILFQEFLNYLLKYDGLQRSHLKFFENHIFLHNYLIFHLKTL